MRSVLVVVLAGCFSPQPAAGIPCADPGASARCPSGLVCITTGGIETCERPGGSGLDGAVDDGTIDDAPPLDASIDALIDACVGCLDTDSDGIADTNDNCPARANSDQSNEDNDAVGDVCDPCPINADNTDSDGDGLGNFCDPSGATVDRLLQFVSFHSGLPAGWGMEGDVTIANGEARLDAPSGTGAYITYASPVASFVSIWVSYTFVAFDGGTLAGMGVMDRRQVGQDASFACQLVGNVTQTSHDIRLFDASSTSVVAMMDHPMNVGTSSIVRMTRDGASWKCSASAPFVEVEGTTAFDPANEHIGARVRSGAATAKWIMVTTR